MSHSMQVISSVSMFLESLAVSKCSPLTLLESSLFLLHGLQRILNWDFKLVLLNSVLPEVLCNFWGLFVWAKVYGSAERKTQVSGVITCGRTLFCWSIHLFYHQDLLRGQKCHSNPITKALRRSFAVGLATQNRVTARAALSFAQTCSQAHSWAQAKVGAF